MIEAGTEAPDFSLKGTFGTEFRLSEVLREQHVVLHFYPKNRTFG